jgi:hypothetical protein
MNMNGDSVNSFFNNPWTQIGLGILASNKPGVGWGQSVGQGGLLGLKNFQDMQYANQQNQYRQMQMQQMRDAMEREKKRREAYGMPGTPAVMEDMGGFQGPPETLQQAVPGTGIFAQDPQARMNAMKQVAGYSEDPMQSLAALQEMIKGPERKIIKDAAGRQRYADTGEYVFNDVGPMPKDPKVEFDRADKLRDEFTTGTKQFAEQNDAFGRIIASAEEPSAAGDLALIFNYMKLLDPGSVVRESEFRTAEDAKAWLGRADEKGIAVPTPIRTAIQKAREGTFLLPEQRYDFVKRSGMIYKKARQGYDNMTTEYTRLSKHFGVDPAGVITRRMIYDPNQLNIPAPPEAPTDQMQGLSAEQQNRLEELRRAQGK